MTPPDQTPEQIAAELANVLDGIATDCDMSYGLPSDPHYGGRINASIARALTVYGDRRAKEAKDRFIEVLAEHIRECGCEDDQNQCGRCALARAVLDKGDRP